MGLPLWKNGHFSNFWTSCFYSLERRFYVLEYHKRHFPGLCCLQKKFEKSPFLDTNHGIPPLEKWPFSTFWTSCFYSLERRFFVLEYRKIHFLPNNAKKKNLEKWPFLDQKHGLTPLEKMSVFRLFELLVFII